MNKYSFYEVLNDKGRWMGNYSLELDDKSFIAMSAFNMAKINAKHCNGSIYGVDFEGERELVWPK